MQARGGEQRGKKEAPLLPPRDSGIPPRPTPRSPPPRECTDRGGGARVQARGGEQRAREVDAGEELLKQGEEQEDAHEDGDIDVQILYDLGWREGRGKSTRGVGNPVRRV